MAHPLPKHLRPHPGYNKIPCDFWEPDPLQRHVRDTVEHRLFFAYWFRQSIRLQMAFRCRCERRWRNASSYVILLEGWHLLIGAEDRLGLLRSVSGFDLEFGSAMFTTLCIQQDPSLDTLD